MPISKKPEKLVVDANPIFSTLLGEKAKRLFFESGISEFAVTGSILDEIHTYIPTMAQKLGVRQDFLFYTLDLLPLTVYRSKTYRHSITRAKMEVAHRDPDDVEILAFAIELGHPLWTNDKDFEKPVFDCRVAHDVFSEAVLTWAQYR